MRFAFGENWKSYSKNAVTPERIAQARAAFGELLGPIELRGKSFLDIGFGQGLSLSIAAGMGASALGVDIDENNLEALRVVSRQVGLPEPPPVRVGSILDTAFVRELGRFDIVHSWGVLHHTGDMRLAVANACGLVKDGGHLVCAIYNRHWTSPVWTAIKWCYNASPGPVRRAMIGLFYPIIFAAKFAVTGENPKKKDRGMDFFHDVVDWVGGYPYEYASIEEFTRMAGAHGFRLLKSVPAQVPTGCNEFVFQKAGA